jgi:iron complex outermembrane receptor protein
VVEGCNLSASYNYVGSSYLISDQDNALRKLEDFSTVDAKLSYSIKGIEAFVGINNLTDEKYSEYGVAGGGGTTRNFYPAPVRNWWAGINFNL